MNVNFNLDSFPNCYNTTTALISPKRNILVEGTVVAAIDQTIYIHAHLKQIIKFFSAELKTTDQIYNNNYIGKKLQLTIGQSVDYEGAPIVTVNKVERKKIRQEMWSLVTERKFVNGTILNLVNGGMSVGIGGIVCFLPNNQIGRSFNKEELIGSHKTFFVLKVNEAKRNIILSRTIAIQKWTKYVDKRY